MEDIFTNLKLKFKQGNLLIRLLMINAIVFVIAATFTILTRLFGLPIEFVIQYVELPASFGQLLLQPWSLLTYMFLHTSFFHILFNLLWLYWFGQLFLRRYTERNLLTVYLLGGIVGGLLYMISYNLLPALQPSVPFAYLLGASASILAIVVATAVAMPNERVLLMFLGPVKLKYIALFVVALSFFNVASDNAGGNIAHLGGALFGYIFATSYLKGKDITRSFALIIDKIVNLFKGNRKMKVQKGGARKVDIDYNNRKAANQQEIDRILDKIKRSGYDSLTNEEKQKLFNAGKR